LLLTGLHIKAAAAAFGCDHERDQRPLGLPALFVDSSIGAEEAGAGGAAKA